MCHTIASPPWRSRILLPFISPVSHDTCNFLLARSLTHRMFPISDECRWLVTPLHQEEYYVSQTYHHLSSTTTHIAPMRWCIRAPMRRRCWNSRSRYSASITPKLPVCQQRSTLHMRIRHCTPRTVVFANELLSIVVLRSAPSENCLQKAFVPWLSHALWLASWLVGLLCAPPHS